MGHGPRGVNDKHVNTRTTPKTAIGRKSNVIQNINNKDVDWWRNSKEMRIWWGVKRGLRDARATRVEWSFCGVWDRYRNQLRAISGNEDLRSVSQLNQLNREYQRVCGDKRVGWDEVCWKVHLEKRRWLDR